MKIITGNRQLRNVLETCANLLPDVDDGIERCVSLCYAVSDSFDVVMVGTGTNHLYAVRNECHFVTDNRVEMTEKGDDRLLFNLRELTDALSRFNDDDDITISHGLVACGKEAQSLSTPPVSLPDTGARHQRHRPEPRVMRILDPVSFRNGMNRIADALHGDGVVLNFDDGGFTAVAPDCEVAVESLRNNGYSGTAMDTIADDDTPLKSIVLDGKAVDAIVAGLNLLKAGDEATPAGERFRMTVDDTRLSLDAYSGNASWHTTAVHLDRQFTALDQTHRVARASGSRGRTSTMEVSV